MVGTVEATRFFEPSSTSGGSGSQSYL